MFVFGFRFGLRLAVSFLFNRCRTSLSNQGLRFTFLDDWGGNMTIYSVHKTITPTFPIIVNITRVGIKVNGVVSKLAEIIARFISSY